MSAVWKRLQRVNKRAAKFQFVASYQELAVEGTKKWQPNRLIVVWTRRSRRYCTQAKVWDPTLKNPYRGLVVWTVPENVQITITLFKDQRTNQFEDKDWTFVIENVSPNGKRHLVASASINMKEYASMIPTQTDLNLKLKPLSKKVADASLTFTLSCVFLREGKATDEDMQSLASLMSLNMPLDSDIGNLDDFEEESFIETHSEETTAQISEFASKMAQLAESSVQLKAVSQPAQVTPKSPVSHELIQDTNTSSSPSSNEDLLSWCKGVTKDYCGINITNMTTSWRNGMAFCAIIHHYRPDLISFDSLSPHDIKGNCKLAFDTAERLGIPKVIEPTDMVFLSVPDQLAVMTYVHQMRMHFSKQQSKQSVGELNETSLYSMEDVTDSRSDKDSKSIKSGVDDDLGSSERSLSGHSSSDLQTPEPTKLVTEHVKTEKKSRLSRILNFKKSKGTAPFSMPRSSSADSCMLPAKPVTKEKPFLMTRNQYMNPFDSDEEDQVEPMPMSMSPSPSSANNPSITDNTGSLPCGEIDNRRNEEDLRLDPEVPGLLDLSPARLKRAQSTPTDDHEISPRYEGDPKYKRQQELREKAKKLIEEARQGKYPKFRDYSFSNNKNQNLPNRRSKDQDNEYMNRENSEDRIFFERVTDADKVNCNVPNLTNSAQILNDVRRKSLSPSEEARREYYNKEFSEIEREQNQLDEEGRALEHMLKPLLAKNPEDLSAVPRGLLESWFNYVNRKNALTRREDRLRSKEKEDDFLHRAELVRQELRVLLAIEDSQKTDSQRQCEQALLQELVDLINKRDELAQYTHNTTIAQEEEEEAAQQSSLESTLTQRSSVDKSKACFVQ